MTSQHARLERARRDTIVLLAVMGEPGATMSRLLALTRLPRSAINRTLQRLEQEEIVVRRYIIDETGHNIRAYPVAPADPAASARLADLLHRTTPSPADIRSVA